MSLNVTKEIVQGLSGSGLPVWLVFKTWVRVDGTQASWLDRFDSESEAKHWAKHS